MNSFVGAIGTVIVMDFAVALVLIVGLWAFAVIGGKKARNRVRGVTELTVSQYYPEGTVLSVQDGSGNCEFFEVKSVEGGSGFPYRLRVEKRR